MPKLARFINRRWQWSVYSSADNYPSNKTASITAEIAPSLIRIYLRFEKGGDSLKIFDHIYIYIYTHLYIYDDVERNAFAGYRADMYRARSDWWSSQLAAGHLARMMQLTNKHVFQPANCTYTAESKRIYIVGQLYQGTSVAAVVVVVVVKSHVPCLYVRHSAIICLPWSHSRFVFDPVAIIRPTYDSLKSNVAPSESK